MTDMRACVLTADYAIAYTWYSDGEVWQVDRATGAAVWVTDAPDRDDFDHFLRSVGVMALGEGRRKVERLNPYWQKSEDRGMAEIL